MQNSVTIFRFLVYLRLLKQFNIYNTAPIMNIKTRFNPIFTSVVGLMLLSVSFVTHSCTVDSSQSEVYLDDTSCFLTTE